jgi:hypothetical protein
VLRALGKHWDWAAQGGTATLPLLARVWLRAEWARDLIVLRMPYRKPVGGELPAWKTDLNVVHKRVRARVEHALAPMKSWNILRNCRCKRDGVWYATRGQASIAAVLARSATDSIVAKTKVNALVRAVALRVREGRGGADQGRYR